MIKRMLLPALLFLSLMLSITAHEQSSSIFVIKTEKSGYTSYDGGNLCMLSDDPGPVGDAPEPESPPSPEGLNSNGNDNSTDPSIASTPQKQR
jgi:hypothetical protein